MRKVLFATSEARPYAKTGGLAEVSGSLPVALREAGCDVRVVLPAYRSVLAGAAGLRRWEAPPPVPGAPPLRMLEGRFDDSDVKVWFVDAPELYDRPGGLYLAPDGAEWPDNAARFAHFCRAVAGLADPAADLPWRPDVVHCNDWQTGLVAPLLADLPARPGTVFTIHNLAYQGLFDRATFEALGLPWGWWTPEGLEFWGRWSFVKGGLAWSDCLTTVSPTYAVEIQSQAFGMGLEGLLRHRARDLTGILNGLDCHDWDPECDPALAAPYGPRDLELKGSNKRALQEECGLEPREDALLLGTVGRLTEQKGVDLVLDSLPRWMDGPMQWVVLGEGDAGLRRALSELARERPGQFAFRTGYDEGLAHRIVAGCDAVLMPSRFEPCGLAQLHGLRYGTLPIVRHTGGLADTVVDATVQSLRAGIATGFGFDPATPEAVALTLARALSVFRQPGLWRQMQRAAMAQDFGWGRSARAYLAVYDRAAARAAAPAGAGH